MEYHESLMKQGMWNVTVSRPTLTDEEQKKRVEELKQETVRLVSSGVKKEVVA